MQLDPKNSILLAFKHLDAFSIPQLGTFERVRKAAKIDQHSKKIAPPMEVFVLHAGDAEPSALQDFFFRYYDLKIDQAKELTEKVVAFIGTELQEKGNLFFEGFGLLKGNSPTEAEFEAEESIFGQTTDYFGLQPLDYTVGVAEKPNLEKKQEAARESALANQILVEPAPPPVKRRKFPVGLFLFLLLLLAGSGAAYVYQDELTIRLKDWGIIGGKQIASTDDGGPEAYNALTDAMDSSESNEIDSTNNGLTESTNGDFSEENAKDLANSIENASNEGNEQKVIAETKVIEPKAKVEPKVEPKLEPKAIVQPKTEPTKLVEPKKVTTSTGTFGESAQSGRFYLIVSSTPDGSEAEARAKSISAAGATPKALRGYGFYKISAFDSNDKSKVIAKMVEWKKKYTKSWIYWLGM